MEVIMMGKFNADTFISSNLYHQWILEVVQTLLQVSRRLVCLERYSLESSNTTACS